MGRPLLHLPPRVREGHGTHLMLLHGHEMGHHRVGLLLLLLHAKAVHVLLLTQLLHVLLLLHGLLLLLHGLLLLGHDVSPILILRRGINSGRPASTSAYNARGRWLLLLH